MAFLVFLANDDVGLGHFIIEIVALAGALADPGEHRDAAVQLGNVIDQFHDNDGLADACAAESADCCRLQEGANEINDLDAGGQHLG